MIGIYNDLRKLCVSQLIEQRKLLMNGLRKKFDSNLKFESIIISKHLRFTQTVATFILFVQFCSNIEISGGHELCFQTGHIQTVRAV